METDRLTHQTSGNQPLTGQRQHGVGGCYVTPPPLEDVLFEQLTYLVSHASQDCPPGCAICARLSRVLGPLLEPFRT